MKLLAGCLILLLGTIGCIRIIESEPIIEQKNYMHMVIQIHDCPEFVTNHMNIERALQHACFSCGFENQDVSAEIISGDIITYFIYGDKGYAAAYISRCEKSCALEFFAEEGTYSYPQFTEAFMLVFQIVSGDLEYDMAYLELLA